MILLHGILRQPVQPSAVQHVSAHLNAGTRIRWAGTASRRGGGASNKCSAFRRLVLRCPRARTSAAAPARVSTMPSAVRARCDSKSSAVLAPPSVAQPPGASAPVEKRTVLLAWGATASPAPCASPEKHLTLRHRLQRHH